MYKQVENIIIPKQFIYKSITTLLTPAEAADNSAVLFFLFKRDLPSIKVS